MTKKKSRLIIHVGYPKTGTSTLQHKVYPHLEECQFLGKYNDSEDPDLMFAHPSLLEARNLVNNGSELQFRELQPSIRDGLERLSGTSMQSTFLLSLEGFTDPLVGTHTAQHKDLYMKAKHLSQLFSGPDSMFERCDILLTIRRQEDILPSYFSQSNERGVACGMYTGTWDDFLDLIVSSDSIGLGNYFDFDRVLSIYQEFFGANHVHVAPMEALFTPEPTIAQETMAEFLRIPVKVFRQLLQSDPVNAKSKRRKNSVHYTSGIHNSVFVSQIRRIDTRLRRWPLLSPLTTRGFERFKQGLYSSQFKVSESDVLRIRERYMGSNTKLERLCGLDLLALGYATKEST